MLKHYRSAICAAIINPDPASARTYLAQPLVSSALLKKTLITNQVTLLFFNIPAKSMSYTMHARSLAGSRINGICALLLMLFVASPSAIAEDAIPIEIMSDSLQLQHQKNQAEFAGHVHLIRGDFNLHCNRLVAYYDGNALHHAEAFGHVTMQQGDKQGASDRANYDQQQELLTLLGHASLKGDDNAVQGNKIIYDTRNKRTRILSEKHGQRVKMRIESPSPSAQGKQP